jgi:uncharacterized membrane protein
MAGIGFELRKLLARDSYFALVRAYAYAGLISSGPWVLSIVGLAVIGVASANVSVPGMFVTQFQVSVTYLIAGSLILTGVVQLSFTRWVSDQLFARKPERIVPNFAGLLLVTNLIGGTMAVILALTLFRDETAVYRMLMIAGFVTMCDIWIATIFMSGLKFYKTIVGLFAGGYGASVVLAILLRPWGLEGLLCGYVVGQFLMLAGMFFIIVRSFPAERMVAFDCFRPGAMLPTMMAVGLLYNLAIWIDKIVFWFAADTGMNVIGPLRASVIYDMPVFLAYLSIIPGMAVFLVRFETDFVEWYDKFYNAVREGRLAGRDCPHARRNGLCHPPRTVRHRQAADAGGAGDGGVCPGHLRQAGHQRALLAAFLRGCRCRQSAGGAAGGDECVFSTWTVGAPCWRW